MKMRAMIAAVATAAFLGAGVAVASAATPGPPPPGCTGNSWHYECPNPPPHGDPPCPEGYTQVWINQYHFNCVPPVDPPDDDCDYGSKRSQLARLLR